MASDENHPGRGDDRIEWVTVRYRTIGLAVLAAVALAGLGWVLFAPRTPPAAPPSAMTVDTGAHFTTIEGACR